ncbi:Polyketide synthase/peptide synthetase [Salix suchowensis]|nr:Polyketide synthase/peptide synthetase [Salix suchowensis]
MTSVVVASIDEATDAVATLKRQEYEKGRIAVVNNCGPNTLRPYQLLPCHALRQTVQCPIAQGDSQRARGTLQEISVPRHKSLDCVDVLREDIAKALEWDPFTEKDDNPEIMSDIWDGSILRDFRGPDGKDRFLQLRFAQPIRQPCRGKAVKIGGMYMACLNLPRRIRFLVENVFLVGVVPGPDGPSNSEINGCLRPLVDDLVTLWQYGYSLVAHRCIPRTTSTMRAHPARLRSSGARQISGTASGANDGQCNECHIVRQDMENLDYKTWPKRDSKQHRNLATRWRDALSEKLQAKYFKESHVRWSNCFAFLIGARHDS